MLNSASADSGYASGLVCRRHAEYDGGEADVPVGTGTRGVTGAACTVHVPSK